MELESAIACERLSPPTQMPTLPANSNECNLSPTSEEKRHVRFPSDDVVTNYFEPPDLWPRGVSVPSSQDLLGRYMEACAKYNTRPLQKLTDQLTAVDLIAQRWAPALSLRGEKLDPPQVESMEEILRWIRFRIFDISDTMLDDESATALFDMLEFYDGVENLNISGQKQLTERGWSACARLIRRAASLQALYIRHCTLDSQALRHIGRALQLGGFLSEIHLERSSIGGAGLAHLVAGARTSTTLKRLHLSSCRLSPSDGTHLGILLRQSRSLEALDVEDNQLQDSGCMQVLSGLAANRESQLSDIRLGINQLTGQAANAIAYALVSSPLRSLSLAKNNIGTEGVLAMRDGLLRCHLQHIDLSETRLSCEAAIAIAEIAVESRTLESLDLRGNAIRTAGIMALGLAARMNQKIISIEIDRTRPTVKIGSDNANMLEELFSLTADLDRQLAHNRLAQSQMQFQQQESSPINEEHDENKPVVESKKGDDNHEEHSADGELPSKSIEETDPIISFFGNGEKLLDSPSKHNHDGERQRSGSIHREDHREIGFSGDVVPSNISVEPCLNSGEMHAEVNSESLVSDIVEDLVSAVDITPLDDATGDGNSETVEDQFILQADAQPTEPLVLRVDLLGELNENPPIEHSVENDEQQNEDILD